MDRVQRKRTKGFKLPPNTLCVTRGTQFGNPSKVIDGNNEGAVELFRRWVNKPEQAGLRELFIQTCEAGSIEHLACFCRPDLACHSDVWLEIWNDYQKISIRISLSSSVICGSPFYRYTPNVCLTRAEWLPSNLYSRRDYY